MYVEHMYIIIYDMHLSSHVYIYKTYYNVHVHIHYITLNYIKCHYIALHYITLHTYIHTCAIGPWPGHGQACTRDVPVICGAVLSGLG